MANYVVSRFKKMVSSPRLRRVATSDATRHEVMKSLELHTLTFLGGCESDRSMKKLGVVSGNLLHSY